jgi:hypothetical protein
MYYGFDNFISELTFVRAISLTTFDFILRMNVCFHKLNNNTTKHWDCVLMYVLWIPKKKKKKKFLGKWRTERSTDFFETDIPGLPAAASLLLRCTYYLLLLIRSSSYHIRTRTYLFI